MYLFVFISVICFCNLCKIGSANLKQLNKCLTLPFEYLAWTHLIGHITTMTFIMLENILILKLFLCTIAALVSISKKIKNFKNLSNFFK